MYKIKLTPYAKLFYTEWLLDPNSHTYNISVDQILYGDLDVERLKNAFKRYVTEHVLLNSHIQDINGEPYWVKNESINNLEYLENPVSTSELLDYVSNSFNLYTGSLYRFRLIRVKDGIYRLILVFHHIIVDGSSANLGVYRKISNYYNDESYVSKYSIDRQIELIIRLANELDIKLQQNKNRYKEFWQNQLADVEMVDVRFLKLNDNKKFLPKSNFVTEIRFSYGKTELSCLEQIKYKYKITPYIYGQSILALLLNKYTHQEQFAISYPIAIKEGANFIYGAQINTNLIPYRFNEATKIVDLFNQNLVFFESTIRSDIKYGYYPTADLVRLGDKRALNVYFTQTHLKDQAFTFEGITKVEILNELNYRFGNTIIFY